MTVMREGRRGEIRGRAITQPPFFFLFTPPMALHLVMTFTPPFWCSPPSPAPLLSPASQGCDEGGWSWGVELFRSSTPRRHSTPLARHLTAPCTTTLLGHLPPMPPLSRPLAFLPAMAGCRGSAWGWGRRDGSLSRKGLHFTRGPPLAELPWVIITRASEC